MQITQLVQLDRHARSSSGRCPTGPPEQSSVARQRRKPAPRIEPVMNDAHLIQQQQNSDRDQQSAAHQCRTDSIALAAHCCPSFPFCFVRFHSRSAFLCPAPGSAPTATSITGAIWIAAGTQRTQVRTRVSSLIKEDWRSRNRQTAASIVASASGGCCRLPSLFLLPGLCPLNAK